MKNGVDETSESLPENYSVLSLVYIDNKPVTRAEMLSWPPEPLGNFDYFIRVLARRSYLPHQLLDKVLPVKPNLVETYIIETLGEKIHDYGSLITGFCYGARLGNLHKPYQVLLSLSDSYIEGFCKQVHFLAGDHTPFHAQDLKEAKEKIATLMQHWKKDGYFSDKDLVWILYIIQHMMNGLDLKHLRYPPKSPLALFYKDAIVYSSYRADWVQVLAQLWFYLHYGSLFSDIIEDGMIKQCQVCAKLFSKPKEKRKKKYFDRQVYCCPRCRRKAERHRHYDKNKEKLKPMWRKGMRERRKIYKDDSLSYDKKIRGTL